MSPHAGAEPCSDCLRRAWLLDRLSPLLDHCAPDRERLFALLELLDEELIEALAGSRRAALRAAYGAWVPSEEASFTGTCPHRPGCPAALRTSGSPRALAVGGSVSRLSELTAAPMVALLGCRRPSEYGSEMASSIARALSACGVTVVSSLRSGIGAGAQRGALEGGARCLALVGDGLAVCSRGPQRALLTPSEREGCALAELPPETSGRLWGWAACERLAGQLAHLAVLVEGSVEDSEVRAARRLLAAGTRVGAVPGRVSSPVSAGPHALLREGASLVCGAADVLELLDTGAERAPLAVTAGAALEPLLQSVLDEVGAGRDSAHALAAARPEPLEQILLALTELELLGLLSRGRGGRYTPRLGGSPKPPLDAA